MSEMCIDCGSPVIAKGRCAECLEEVGESPDWRTSDPAAQQPSRSSRPKSATCTACDADFLVSETGPVSKYCSPRCRAWWHNHPGVSTPPLGQCAQCSSPLTRGSQKYCSLRCSEIARGVRLAEPIPPRACALPECGELFRPKSRKQRCCCERHGKILCNREGRASGRYVDPWNDRRRDNYHRRRALKKGASTGRPVKLAEIAERDRWRCGVCRKAVSKRLKWPHPRSPSLDHIVPVTEDGSLHDPVNVRLAHLVCNTSRGNRGGGEQLLLVG